MPSRSNFGSTLISLSRPSDAIVTRTIPSADSPTTGSAGASAPSAPDALSTACRARFHSASNSSPRMPLVMARKPPNDHLAQNVTLAHDASPSAELCPNGQSSADMRAPQPLVSGVVHDQPAT